MSSNDDKIYTAKLGMNHTNFCKEEGCSLRASISPVSLCCLVKREVQHHSRPARRFCMIQ